MLCRVTTEIKNCDLKFLSPQRYDFVLIDVHAMTELYFSVEKTAVP